MNELDLFDVDSLLNLYHCPSCGSNEFNHATCIYCGNTLVDLQTKTRELENLLNRYTYFKLTPNLIRLYGAKDKINLPELTSFLETHHIKEEIEHQKKLIIDKILKEEELSLEEDSFMTQMLKSDLVPDFPTDYVIRSAILKKKLVSLDLFSEMIKTMVVYAMKVLAANKIKNYDPVCEIKEMDDLGEANGISKINLSLEVVKGLYNGEAIYLQTIFHELIHIKQSINIKIGHIDEQTIKYIKEEIIRFVSKHHNIDYYHLEYENLAMEIDANVEGFTCFRRYLQTIGINQGQLLVEDIQKEVEKELARRENTKVNTQVYTFVNDEEINFEELFLVCANMVPACLQKYPQLQVEYLNEEEKVRRKTKEELQATLDQSTKDDENIYLQKLLARLEETPKRS